MASQAQRGKRMPDSDQRMQRKTLSRHARSESQASLISSRSRHEYSRSSLATRFLYLGMRRLHRTNLSSRIFVLVGFRSQPYRKKESRELAPPGAVSLSH